MTTVCSLFPFLVMGLLVWARRISAEESIVNDRLYSMNLCTQLSYRIQRAALTDALWLVVVAGFVA